MGTCGRPAAGGAAGGGGAGRAAVAGTGVRQPQRRKVAAISQRRGPMRAC
jgi:hypothetical protein